MLLRLYNEDTPLMDHSKERFQRQSPQIKQDSDEAPITQDPDDVPFKQGQDDSSIGAECNDAGDVGVDADRDSDVNEGGGVRLREGDPLLNAEETADVEAQAAAELDVALGASDEEDVAMDGGVELG